MFIVLASSSSARRQLLAGIGRPFSCTAPNIDEKALPGESITDYVARLACAKAQALAPSRPRSLIIGSDQACSLEGLIFGKPGDHATARSHLEQFSGQWLEFQTGVAVLDARSGRMLHKVVPYAVKFRHLGADDIERYLAQDRPYNCAGAFMVEKAGLSLFESMKGEDFSSLVGLPLIALCEMMRELGFDPLNPEL